MKLKYCAACKSEEDLQHHHLVTRSEGGSNAPSNLITLCRSCHDKVHVRRTNGTYNHRQRTRAALAIRKAAGKKLGGLRPKTIKIMAAAKARAETLRPVFTELSALSAGGLAAELKRRGVATPRGKPWSAVTVIRLRRRLGGKS